MDFTESDDIRDLRDLLRRFVEKRMPRAEAARWDQQNSFPREILDELGALGVFALSVPEEYGGLGRNIIGTMVAIEELSRRSLAISVPYIMGACYAGMNLVECGSPAQKQAMLPRVATGNLLFAYGWTEPDVGADLASVSTRVTRDGENLIVNGQKRFCSGAESCDYIFTLVRSGNTADRYRNLSVVLVPPTTPGVSISRIEGLGMKGAATTDVVFDNVVVPSENLLGGEAGWDKGWGMIAGSGINVERLEVAAIAVGIAQAALDDAVEYAQQRRQFGKAIGSYQATKHKLADMATQLHAARLVLYQAAWRADRHLPCTRETAMAKLFTTEVAKSISLECQTIFGAYGYVKGFDVERYVRDALLLPIIGGSSAIQRNNIFKTMELTAA